MVNDKAAASVSGADKIGSEPKRREGRGIPGRILGPRLLLICVTVALLVYGLVMLFSASFYEGFSHPDYNDGAHFFIKQLRYAGIGLAFMALAIVIPYKSEKKPWLVWAIVGVLSLAVIFLLVLTLVSGDGVNGSRRWLPIGGQPSEFAKVTVVLSFALLANKLRDNLDWQTLLIALAVVIVPVALILVPKDLGTAVIILFGVFVIAWLADYTKKTLAIGMVLALIVIAAFIILESFRGDRIDMYLDPWVDTFRKGSQIVAAAIALGVGSLFGVGLANSHQKFGFVPQVQDDMIFPIVGEELGLVGTVGLTLLFLLFVYAALRIAANAPDQLGRMIAGGAGAIVGFQAFLNMLCMTGALPMTGKTLPFFSAGGTSIIVTLILVGLTLNVSLRSNVPDLASRRRDGFGILDGGSNPSSSSNSGFSGKSGSSSRWGFEGARPTAQPQPQSKWVKPRTAPSPAGAAAHQPTMASKAGRRAPAQRRSPLQPQAARSAQRPPQPSAPGQSRSPLRPAKAAAPRQPAPRQPAPRQPAPRQPAAQSPFFNPVRSGSGQKSAASYSGRGRR